MGKLTPSQSAALKFLDDGRMEATADQVGSAVYAAIGPVGGSNLLAIGQAICGHMRRRGLAVYLPDMKAWRISDAGRAALKEGRDA